MRELAAEYGVSMVQIALAWVLHKDVVDALTVGTTSIEHLEEAVAAVERDLAESDIDYIEAPYVPVPVPGHE